ncbi:ADP-ribosyl cyclase/cyclic ADP-ribose hydrolase-like [Liolophura sinensis]|uniref:ADP-ribosyl cyclase/cyclic ADP-ribose hydrolase-like n=1 Tax=Liolophura sinensis TaxID=3198878 RepID=UPI0031597B49
MLFVVLTASLLVGSSLVPGAQCRSCGQSLGTTKNFEDIFKGRCYDYVEKINPQAFCGKKNKSCDELWDTFRSAFTNTSSCNTSAYMYSAFINASTHSLPRGKSMFWQGVSGFVHELTYRGKRYFALEDTLYGYTLNQLNWCWSGEAGDFNYTLCPNRNVCPSGPKTTYWEAASREFAKVASGTVQVMINGSRFPPYNRTGFFGRVELPAMNTSKVDRIRILLAHDLKLHVVEDCNGKSITELKADIKARGMEVECTDDPKWVRFYMCVDHPNHPICKNLTSKAHSNTAFGVVLYILLFSIKNMVSR